ncbi:2-keto-4-pentenoate hydratase/2-oxohepta-3-ene-1,7-dioic acid hydratase (catechol pathway) [Sphingobium faniae]|nr:2-keto-4-pentenoate hydratase/2-oxohepta-3-ene-1,7-dioic acid hydratase (catechol pathway) [Sphingobium faniae]
MSYKLLTYAAPEGPRAGVLLNNRVHDAQALARKASYATMHGILADWDEADALFASLDPATLGDGKALADTTLLPPLLYPGQIWAAGANYQDHIGEMADHEYKAVNAKTISGGRPWHFSKSVRSVAAPGSAIPLPHYSSKVDWEIELAVVIGRQASRVAARDALDYVAGYTIANDLSARDFVAREGIEPSSPFRYDWLSHKGFDGACPMGPWIVPARDIRDPGKLDMKLWLDGEIMQDSSTRHMIFDIGEQIEEISARITMYPGDVILTGTPSGVGMGRGFFLKSGQNLRLWIEGIGELEHSVV